MAHALHRKKGRDNDTTRQGNTARACRDHSFTLCACPGGALGFSLGGYIAQHLTLQHPQRVRRLILAGTGPGKGEGTQDLNQTILEAASGPSSRNGLLRLFFEPTETSQAAGAAFWDRLQTRTGEHDPFLTGPGVQAQRTALTRWDQGEDAAYPR